MINKLELLAPAGNFEKLETAIRYGADAVYLSGKQYGMRAYSGNFDNEELKKAIELAHANNVKIYITINIIAHNDDLNGLENYFKYLESINTDAVIISDFGILRILKKTGCKIPIHISTQFSAMNYETFKFLEELGVERIVVPRELSYDEMKQINENSKVDKEAFVHGAMCMAYSGRCMLSYHTKDRDANRGECNQSCRFQYKLSSKQMGSDMYVEEDDKMSYFFNSKDLCLIEHIDKLVDAGITSFKIEGRMKTLSYLAPVIQIYRKAIDAYNANQGNYKCDPKWLEELQKISHRGYTTFKFLDKKIPNAQEIDKSKAIMTHDIAGIVKEIVDKKYMVIEVKSAFSPEMEMEIIIPKKRILNVVFHEIKDVLMRKIERTNPNQIVLLRHYKSVVPGSILRVKKNKSN